MVLYGPHQAVSDATPIARGKIPLAIPMHIIHRPSTGDAATAEHVVELIHSSLQADRCGVGGNDQRLQGVGALRRLGELLLYFCDVLMIRRLSETVPFQHVDQAELNGACDPEQGVGSHCRKAQIAGFLRGKPGWTRRR